MHVFHAVYYMMQIKINVGVPSGTRIYNMTKLLAKLCCTDDYLDEFGNVPNTLETDKHDSSTSKSVLVSGLHGRPRDV
jgi:hypothetical protein